MKRDLDLVRTILMALEDHEHGFAPNEFRIKGHTDEEVGFHVLLMGEAGLLKSFDSTTTTSLSPQGMPGRLTWDGYEFLDAARNASVWEEAKQQIRNGGVGMSFAFLKELLVELGKKAIGLS